MQIRMSMENEERIETVQEYFKELRPVAVHLSAPDVVTMALRELAAAIESRGYADEGIQASRAAQEIIEEGE